MYICWAKNLVTQKSKDTLILETARRDLRCKILYHYHKTVRRRHKAREKGNSTHSTLVISNVVAYNVPSFFLVAIELECNSCVNYFVDNVLFL